MAQCTAMYTLHCISLHSALAIHKWRTLWYVTTDKLILAKSLEVMRLPLVASVDNKEFRVSRYELISRTSRLNPPDCKSLFSVRHRHFQNYF